MDLCKLILLSITGYIILLIHDLSQMKKSNIITRITYISYPIIVTPYIGIFIMYIPNITTPAGLLILYSLLISGLSLLLLYSVLLEIPIKIKHGKFAIDRKNRTVYKQGTYSFSRHPGFIWMTLLNASFYGLLIDGEILILATVLTLCNLALIMIEDFYIFPIIFRDYNQYKKEVPFICKFPFIKKS